MFFRDGRFDTIPFQIVDRGEEVGAQDAGTATT